MCIRDRFYSAPPLRLHSRGLGELTVALIVPVLTPLVGYTIQQGAPGRLPLLAVTPLACFQVAMIDDLSDLGDVAQRLAGWLQQRHPEQAAPTVGGLVRSDAGYSNITVLGEIGWRGEEANRAQPVVLRLQTSTPSVFPDCDITRQYRVLQALAGSSVPVPRLLGLETDPAALGAPFFLMERVAGRVPNENPLYHLEGWFHDLASEELRQYWFSGIDTVAAVARVDWRARGLGFLQPPAGLTPLQQQLSLIHI